MRRHKVRPDKDLYNMIGRAKALHRKGLWEGALSIFFMRLSGQLKIGSESFIKFPRKDQL